MDAVGLLCLSALLAGAGSYLMRRREVAMARSQRLAARDLLRFGSLLLLLVPPVVYAASAALPHVFVAGALTDADEMNANFEAIATAVNDNDSRIDTLLDQSCPAGEAVTGVDAAGNLLCAPPL